MLSSHCSAELGLAKVLEAMALKRIKYALETEGHGESSSYSA
jgi:hypothetical protein